jgi:hypothetical protein
MPIDPGQGISSGQIAVLGSKMESGKDGGGIGKIVRED